MHNVMLRTDPTTKKFILQSAIFKSCLFEACSLNSNMFSHKNLHLDFLMTSKPWGCKTRMASQIVPIDFWKFRQTFASVSFQFHVCLGNRIGMSWDWSTTAEHIWWNDSGDNSRSDWAFLSDDSENDFDFDELELWMVNILAYLNLYVHETKMTGSVWHAAHFKSQFSLS
jgi:hypothetical protein